MTTPITKPLTPAERLKVKEEERRIRESLIYKRKISPRNDRTKPPPVQPALYTGIGI